MKFCGTAVQYAHGTGKDGTGKVGKSAYCPNEAMGQWDSGTVSRLLALRLRFY
ncbi:hypothetical protein Mal15_28530 [Stieleria maiorica]|uniref:Uncharacterized protein n=1 Tax=Stieleria maiorica TaxID=2795974 RepID=A0A5B9MIF3_9BACT|nr:hypothetical protein Mal15_28530 [Stieleria maiorica]